MTKQAEILSDFLDSNTINSLPAFLENSSGFESSVDLIAVAFGSNDGFSKTDENGISKLVSSFKNNLTLLIQKTWVEKSDIALKDQLLYQLNEFRTKNTWKEDYLPFLQIINQAVFLMFGQNPDSEDFAEYSLRIDPEFGIFWWYISNLPKQADWSEDKYRLAMMLGMYFLANY
ncbi:MAG: hypothetical protein IJ688_07215 [Treponema sp.]|nr:hypothetical protein [Treponema sp.]